MLVYGDCAVVGIEYGSLGHAGGSGEGGAVRRIEELSSLVTWAGVVARSMQPEGANILLLSNITSVHDIDSKPLQCISTCISHDE